MKFKCVNEMNAYSYRIRIWEKMACINSEYVCPATLLMDDSAEISVHVFPSSGWLAPEALHATKSGILNDNYTRYESNIKA